MTAMNDFIISNEQTMTTYLQRLASLPETESNIVQWRQRTLTKHGIDAKAYPAELLASLHRIVERAFIKVFT